MFQRRRFPDRAFELYAKIIAYFAMVLLLLIMFLIIYMLAPKMFMLGCEDIDKSLAW